MSLLKSTKEVPVSGTVIGRSGAQYRVQTGSGKIILAGSGRAWSIGTGVTVLAGVIIETSGRPQPSKVYQV